MADLRKTQPQSPFKLLAVLALILIAGSPIHAEKFEDLKPEGYVNDFAGVLSAGARARLSALCSEVDQKTRAQIAVVTIHTLEGNAIEDFSNRLYERWGIGPKSDNRGVLILLAVDDHRYRVEVGYGLEPILPDGKVGGFGRQIVPDLRRSDYDAALLRLTGSVAAVIAQASGVTLSQSPPAPTDSEESNQPNVPLFVLIALAFLLFGGLRFFLPWALFGLGYRRRGGWWGGGGPWIGGGWSGGGFGGGGGGFGGFGGGISGGGGASGSW